MHFYHIHNPNPSLIINHRPMREQMIDFIAANKRQDQPRLCVSHNPCTSLCCARSANPQSNTLDISRERACGCVCVCAFLCVYVSGSNEAEDEADIKSIRRCQFGLILKLSCQCTTHTHTRAHTHTSLTSEDITLTNSHLIMTIYWHRPWNISSR